MLNGLSGTGNVGLNQMPIGAVANSSAVVPGQGFGGMMSGITGANGLGSGTIMSSIGQHLALNGSTGTPGTVNATGLGIGGMMGTILQGAQINADPTGTSTNIVQTMLNIMDDIPGLHLNGSVGSTTTSAVPGFGFGGMMGAILQDAQSNTAGTSGTGSNIVQSMLDIMDNMPGIGLVGVGHMNFLDSGVA